MAHILGGPLWDFVEDENEALRRGSSFLTLCDSLLITQTLKNCSSLIMDAQELPGAIFALRKIFTLVVAVSGRSVRKSDTITEK